VTPNGPGSAMAGGYFDFGVFNGFGGRGLGASPFLLAPLVFE
jgi:hypothetical protein